MNNSFVLFFLGFLVLITVAKAQVFEDGGLWNLKIGQSVIIKNKEFSSGYQFGSRRQYTVRGPAFSKIQIQCDISIGYGSQQCTTSNGMYFLIDGIRYLNRSNPVQVCSSTYQTTSIYNTLVFGHYSSNDANSQTGAYYCVAKAVSDGTCDCGWRTQARIVGGEDAPANGYPFMAAVIGNNGALLGGASIISSNTLLSAAHVVLDGYGQLRDVNSFKVHLGRQNLAADEWHDTIYSISMKVASIKIHPNYTEGETDYYDMAIISTQDYIPFSKGVGPGCIPNPGRNPDSYTGKNATLLGWGSTIDFGSPYSSVLQRGVAQILSKTQCPNNVASKMCTGSQTGVDSCQGDSGGPAVIFDEYTNRLMVIGVTQSGIGCGGIAVEEFVPFYKQWLIDAVSSDNYYCFYN